eukprot:gene32803-43845_t
MRCEQFLITRLIGRRVARQLADAFEQAGGGDRHAAGIRHAGQRHAVEHVDARAMHAVEDREDRRANHHVGRAAEHLVADRHRPARYAAGEQPHAEAQRAVGGWLHDDVIVDELAGEFRAGPRRAPETGERGAGAAAGKGGFAQLGQGEQQGNNMRGLDARLKLLEAQLASAQLANAQQETAVPATAASVLPAAAPVPAAVVVKPKPVVAATKPVATAAKPSAARVAAVA